MKFEGDVDTNDIQHTRNSFQRLEQRVAEAEIAVSIEIIQTTALLKSNKKLLGVPET